MSDSISSGPPAALRAAIAAELSPVRPLRPPLVRAMAMAPLAALLLVAAPLAFSFRDLRALGWVWSWGASVLQLVGGLLVIAAALRESVPGRPWSGHALLWLVTVPVMLVMAIALGSWQLSPVLVTGSRLFIGAVCLVSSAITALPATILAVILALRAFPTRPALTGWLAGLGAGLMADAGWRLFCHFSEPAHVLAAHLGGVLAAGVVGACLTRWMMRRA